MHAGTDVHLFSIFLLRVRNKRDIQCVGLNIQNVYGQPGASPFGGVVEFVVGCPVHKH